MFHDFFASLTRSQVTSTLRSLGYPDVIIMTQKGNIVLVETKGEHLKNDDSAQKARLGRAWQNSAGKGYRYYMVFRDTDPRIDGMISMSEFLSLLHDL